MDQIQPKGDAEEVKKDSNLRDEQYPRNKDDKRPRRD
jgi:hypothetical protein